MAGNLLGAIISSNIITPMLRNPIAAMRQKTAIAASMHATKPLVKPVESQSQTNNKPQVAKMQNNLYTNNSGRLRI